VPSLVFSLFELVFPSSSFRDSRFPLLPPATHARERPASAFNTSAKRVLLAEIKRSKNNFTRPAPLCLPLSTLLVGTTLHRVANFKSHRTFHSSQITTYSVHHASIQNSPKTNASSSKSARSPKLSANNIIIASHNWRV
jgi:hypothetical protein